MNFFKLIVSGLYIIAAGCSTGYTTFHAGLSRVSLDGLVHLNDGRQFRLAGIKFRPIEETQEPDALSAVTQIVNQSNRPVQVLIRDGDPAVVVSYHQKWQFRDDYTGLMRLSGPYYHRERLNELLIVLGLATYDPNCKAMRSADRDRLKAAQSAYDDAIHDWARAAARHGTKPAGILAAKLRTVEQCLNRQYEFYEYDLRHGYHFVPRPAPGDRQIVARMVETLSSRDR